MIQFLHWDCPTCKRHYTVEIDDTAQFSRGPDFQARYVDPAFDALRESVADHDCSKNGLM